MRGFLGGKGSAEEIKNQLIKRLNELNIKRDVLNPIFVQKFAKRERIGIDCSGLAYRILDELIRKHYKASDLISLEQIFTGGINKTNASTLTSLKFCIMINNISDIKMGDLIRMMGGKHVLVVTAIKDKLVEYIHSSNLTMTQGVHREKIRILDMDKQLQHQAWEEKTKTGINFGEKFFHQEKGDGIYRLKIFNPPSRKSPIVKSWDVETLFRFGEVYAPTKRIIQIPRPKGRGSFN